MESIRVMSVFGTRPEAIKMCPLALAIQRDPALHGMVCLTGQHREMLRQATEIFGVQADFDLDIMQPGQTLEQITARVLEGTSRILAEQKPDVVLVHGDTTTSMAAALAAFYARIPVGHVEAGLRTQSIDSPFPEELNRRVTGRMASLHFAPTQSAAQNLQMENTTKNVFVTGNTAIDALRYTVREAYTFHNPQLRKIDLSRRIVLMTSHRRENWGRPLENILDAVTALTAQYPDVQFVYPVHPNPIVHDAVYARLADNPGVLLTEPVDVEDMHNLMARAYLVMTDSGGLQEEAPALGVPVIVLREETERPEAVESGTVVLAGTGRDDILRIGSRLLGDKAAYADMARAVSPYGDGYASEKITGHIKRHFGI